MKFALLLLSASSVAMPHIPPPPITDFEAYDKNTKEQYEALGHVNAVPINTRFPPDDLKRLDAWIARQVERTGCRPVAAPSADDRGAE
jgi:hypothetical protein